MEKGGVSSMDSSVQDVWDWEVLPDGHRSFYTESRAVGHVNDGREVPLAGKIRISRLDPWWQRYPLEFHTLIKIIIPVL
jgi:hypothetical protein